MADRLVILDAGRVAQSGTPEEIYRRPNSPFVASFMGATNVIPLVLTFEGDRTIVAPGPFNDAVQIDALVGADAVLKSTNVNVHFRSEDARLCPPGAVTEGCLLLRGEVVQSSYPGGSYRYAIRVGPNRYLVDDQRRFAIGEAVGVALPAAALYCFAPSSDTQAGTQLNENGG